MAATAGGCMRALGAGKSFSDCRLARAGGLARTELTQSPEKENNKKQAAKAAA